MSVQFSRVRLNPTRRHTRRLIASPQSMHAAVLGSHPAGVECDEGRVLWRIDQKASHSIELLVVSPTTPDFTGIVEQAGWPTVETWDTTAYLPFLARLARGQRWRFRLVANPVRSLPVEGGRGRVVPHLTVAHQESWFMARTESWGFRVPERTDGGVALATGGRHTSEFTRASPDGEPIRRGQVSITRAEFEGILEVEDADLLRFSLTHGMGRAKAYGCGLMTLARP